MTGLPFLFLFLQYIAGAISIVGLSLLATAKFKANPVALSLLAFGICIAVWDILVFFHRIAETADASLTILKASVVIGPFIFGFYFLIFLNIWQVRKINLLCMIPSFFGSVFSLNIISQVTKSDSYGWSYQMQPLKLDTALTIYGATIIYVLAITVVLTYLSLKSPNKNLRKRFLYILTVFILFQVIGLVVTNVLLIQGNPNSPPLGGIFHLATFVAISYAVFSPVKEEALKPKAPEVVTSPEEFLRSLYTSFTQDSRDMLGSRYFQFVTYLRGCGLEKIIDFDGNRLLLITPKKEEIGASQLACLVDKCFFLLERNEVPPKFLEELVAFLNGTYQQIGPELVKVLKKHEEYVKNSEILYKVAQGKFRLLLTPEGYSEEDLERFSSGIGLTHEKLKKTNVLLELSTGKDYLDIVEDFIQECISNGEEVHIFTRKESPMNLKLKGTLNVSFSLLSPSSSKAIKVDEREKVIPTRELSEILGIFLTITRSGKHYAIVFDNLTDFLLLTAFDQTYKMVRHALDLQASSKVHSLFLINKDAHSKEIFAALEPLFHIIVKR
ncbi:MAG: hypothetical protein ACUVQ8_07050 [Nitrososphaeria archaeon]